MLTPSFKNFITKTLFFILIFFTGIISFLGYLYDNSALDKVLLMYAYLSPVAPFMVLLGQCIGILLCNFLSKDIMFLKNNFDSPTLIHIIVFKIIWMFFCSLLFKKILHRWSWLQIVKFFILLSMLHIILQYLSIFLFNMIPTFKLLNALQNISYWQRLLYYTKYFQKYSLVVLQYTSNIYFPSPQNLLTCTPFGFNSLIANINLFFKFSWACFLLSILQKEVFSEKFSKFDQENILIYKWYKLFMLLIFLSIFIFWYLQLHFFALMLYSLFLSLFFLFFLLGFEMIINLFRSFFNNTIIVRLGLYFLMNMFPMFFFITTILGFVESIFNLRNKND